VNGRQEAAITHLRLVGRDVHRYASYALEYGISAEQVKQAIADGVAAAEREEGSGGERRQVVRAI
jgi:uncharacterized protein YpmB